MEPPRIRWTNERLSQLRVASGYPKRGYGRIVTQLWNIANPELNLTIGALRQAVRRAMHANSKDRELKSTGCKGMVESPQEPTNGTGSEEVDQTGTREKIREFAWAAHKSISLWYRRLSKALPGNFNGRNKKISKVRASKEVLFVADLIANELYENLDHQDQSLWSLNCLLFATAITVSDHCRKKAHTQNPLESLWEKRDTLRSKVAEYQSLIAKADTVIEGGSLRSVRDRQCLRLIRKSLKSQQDIRKPLAETEFIGIGSVHSPNLLTDCGASYRRSSQDVQLCQLGSLRVAPCSSQRVTVVIKPANTGQLPV